ncbi:DNA polymerase III subunit gamma/tau [Alteromonas sp. ASW11-130]|uniref:DNA polymerase III subunit gamma/tau n=1 Tax=Alteromonas sp. ASW11-130 TaxID=3015775 RepID=UPI00224259CC|nr:DNA polymerase III subunit gamma/tau [Alteromonas sp. ASW11-130]MCW8092508.1 DNA polymerase III subunit gamma/tau [Alteromonas sp. ASW11-130]
MSYQVLARKWRPGKFGELVGQEHVKTAIINALENNRLHHAYLFTGTRGVGKTTIARIFSKSLNCEEGQGANPCGQCHTCIEIEQGNYVDLLEIDAASRTKVEDTRELLDNVQYKPTRGRFKVYLIDEVHMLSKHSFNALLKTLEEPPPHVKFLLATTDPQKLPITILSRCLQFNLKSLSREQISSQLEYILDQESVSFETNALGLLARAAQGSMRDALSLTDQAIAQGNNQVSAKVVSDMLGLMDRNQVLKLLVAITSKNAEDVLAIVEDMSSQAPDYNQILAELSSLIHQIALTQWVPEACKLETTSAKMIYQLAKGLAPEVVQLMYQITLQGKKDLPYAVDGRSGLEMTLLRMMSFAPVAGLENTQPIIEAAQPNTSVEQPMNELESRQSDGGEPASMLDSEETDNTESLHQQVDAIEAQAAQLRESSLRQTAASVEGMAFNSPGEEDDAFEQNVDKNSTPPSTSAAVKSTEPAQSSQSSLSSVEEMLALRKRLKAKTEEENAAAVKKSEAATPVASLSELRNSANVKNDGDEETSTPQTESQAVKLADSELVTPDNDVPPWVTEDISAKEQSEPLSDAPIAADEDIRPLISDEVEFKSPGNYQGPLTAYLENGEKLLHASQIDNWSAQVEQMGIAGLLKQLALHASFERQGNIVTLEIDESQSHLINESSTGQLQEALCNVLNENVKLVVNTGKPARTPFSLQQDVNAMRQTHAEAVFEKDEAIQTLLNTFSGKVLLESIRAR